MVEPVKTDLIPLLQNFVAAIQPFAKANFVILQFETSLEKAEIEYHPESIIPDLTQLLCRVITFTPQEYKVTLDVQKASSLNGIFVQVRIVNTGVSLAHLKDIVSGLKNDISISEVDDGGTSFEIQIEGDQQEDLNQNEQKLAPIGIMKYTVPPFYKKLKEQLRFRFTSIKNLEKAASARDKREGVFLKKVNAIITANLAMEGFDTNALSRAVALSRSQLYRRLKPLVQYAPANYIRYVRLLKAKELIEKDDQTVGEAAFMTGFINQSHFTRAFREQFGFNPSALRQNLNVKEKMISVEKPNN